MCGWMSAEWVDKCVLSGQIGGLKKLEYHCYDPKGVVLPSVLFSCDTIHFSTCGS
jgi:hypothetical protein